MDVWVIETGDYADRVIVSVASSVDAAARFVRNKYVGSYKIRWDEPVRLDEDRWEITGHLTRDGPITYEFSRFTVIPTGGKVMTEETRFSAEYLNNARADAMRLSARPDTPNDLA